MTIKAVLWDMDGVLVDSEVYWFAARQAFARDLGKTWTADDQHHAMGRNTIEWAAVMRERLAIDWSLAAIMDDMINRMKAKFEAHLPTRPGAIEAVHLAASRYRVGLASGSPTALIQHVMRLTGLDTVFEVMIYGDDIPNGKPAPDIYLELLRQMYLSPAEAVGVEDSRGGVRSLAAAGIRAIAAPSPAFPLPEDILALAAVKIDTLEAFTLDLVAGLE